MDLLISFADSLRVRGWSDAWIFAFCFNATYIVVVWGLTLLFGLVDHLQLLSSFKIQKGKWPDAKLYKQAWVEQVIHTMTNPLVLWAVYSYGLEGRIRMSGPLDSWPVFALKTVLFFVWLDFAFYWEHRLAHHPALYKYVHKQHHLFKQSVAVAYEFAHPAEGLLVNGLPLFIGFYFAHMHLAQVCLFLFIRITETIDAHSGYDFPWSPWRYLSGARAHDLHHSKQVGNFGIFHFWDWFCSTTVEDMRQARQEKQS